MDKNELLKEMLNDILTEEQLDDFDNIKQLSKSQKLAFEKFKEGKNLAVLSSAGYGKSFLVKTMYEYNKANGDKPMYLCATTGIAAYNLNGVTIHSFMGFGTGSGELISLIRKISKSKTTMDKLKSEHILVIDEISMLSAELFEKINSIYKHFRRSNSFFGGIQVILSGDVLQLLSVFNNNTYINKDKILDERLIVESKIFTDNVEIVILRENFRQVNDTSFLDMLNRIRLGKINEDDIALLKEKRDNFEKELKQLDKGITPIHLVVSNNKALAINSGNLSKINSPTVRYIAQFVCKGHDSDIIDSLKKELESQFKIRGLLDLTLKIGARVMLIKNLDTNIGLVNGALGTILELNHTSVKVKFDNGITFNVCQTEWELELYNNTVKVSQVPLILSYAITIHRCISLTLENAIMDLNDCFCDNQFYTAISRVKNLDGLLLKSFNEKKVLTNKTMLNFINKIE